MTDDIVRILIVKTSSMGDVIHALPVVTDIVRALPAAHIDWVVEEGFADLPRLHPAVADVIPVAVRRWRRSLLQAGTWQEIGAARDRLRAARYDLVIDLQGLVKSAWVARWAGAPVAGFDRTCAREPLAAMAYQHRFRVDPDRHAIERLRALAAQALHYRLEGPPVFDLVRAGPAPDWCAAHPYVVFLHATSRAEKLWPAAHWTALGARLAEAGLRAVLPWGSTAERAAAQALADAVPQAIVAPRLTLAQCALVLGGAHAVVGVDTGLTHLSAALDVPTVALFAATEAWRYGPYWTSRAMSLGRDGVWPTTDEVLSALDQVTGAPAP